jgi:hypothetical protein
MKRFLFILVVLFTLSACTSRPNVIEQPLSQNWTLTGDTLDINLPVTVPSVVQQNLYEAGLIPHPYLGTVENDLLWISNTHWTYLTHFNVSKELLENDVVELVFEGIDTYASVTLNGQKLFDANNQFRAWKQDVKPLLTPSDNLLTLEFPRYDSLQTALYEAHQPRLPERYAVSRKAPYQHGWDWAPKYKNVGIWKPVKLIAWSTASLENAYIVTNEAAKEQAQLTLHLDVESTDSRELTAELLNHTSLTIVLDERVVLLGRAFREGLEPMRIVRHAVLLGPRHHAGSHSIGHLSVEASAIVDDIYHLIINVLRQVLVHLLAVEDVLAKVFARSLCWCFYVKRLLLECLADNLKSQIVCHNCVLLKGE